MQRLKRVFAIEIERCRGCGGRLEVIASIEDPALIERILAHVRQRGEEELAAFDGAAQPASIGATDTCAFAAATNTAMQIAIRNPAAADTRVIRAPP